MGNIGRTGAWQGSTGHGNPCDSTEVLAWLKAYERIEWKAGVEPIAAFPVSAALIHALIDLPDVDIAAKRAGGDYLGALLLEWDCMLYLYWVYWQILIVWDQNLIRA